MVSAVDYEPIGRGFESHRRRSLLNHCDLGQVTLHYVALSPPRRKPGIWHVRRAGNVNEKH